MAKPKKRKAASKAKPKTKAKPKAKAKPKTKAKPKAKAKAKATAKPKTKAKPKAQPAAAPPPALEQADVMRMDGMNVPSREERAAAVADAAGQPRFAEVRAEVLGAFRSFYPSPTPESDEQILETDPNDFDVDPAPFYEHLEQRFGVAPDPDHDYFGGLGGKVRDTIANLTRRWDGVLRK